MTTFAVEAGPGRECISCNSEKMILDLELYICMVNLRTYSR